MNTIISSPKKRFQDMLASSADGQTFLIAGPCVVESEDLNMRVATRLAELSEKHSVPVVYKSSFEKGNRTSKDGFVSIGFEKSLRILQKIKNETGLPLLTDVHEYTDFRAVADVVDVLQTPAFLCRQTAFLKRVAEAGRPTNIKKGQFLSPSEMLKVIEKFVSFGNKDVMICERGSMFGYNYLINDFRGLQQLKESGYPIVFDATHSVQRPGGLGDASGGDAKYALGLARAALAVGVNAVFAETHPDPSSALSDGPNMIPLSEIEKLFVYIKRFGEMDF